MEIITYLSSKKFWQGNIWAGLQANFAHTNWWWTKLSRRLHSLEDKNFRLGYLTWLGNAFILHLFVRFNVFSCFTKWLRFTWFETFFIEFTYLYYHLLQLPSHTIFKIENNRIMLGFRIQISISHISDIQKKSWKLVVEIEKLSFEICLLPATYQCSIISFSVPNIIQVARTNRNFNINVK